MREEKKKKRKRILSVVLAVTMGMSMLTGCGASENSQSAETVELKGEYQASPFVQAEINSDTVEWICAAYAVYTQYNHKTLGVIGGLSDQEKESSQDRIKLTLSEGWGINGRDDVTEVINKLLTKGHRETYLKTVKKLEKKGLLELSTEEAMTNFSEDDENLRDIRMLMRCTRNMESMEWMAGITAERFKCWGTVILQIISIWKNVWICLFRSQKSFRVHLRAGKNWQTAIYMDMRSGRMKQRTM